MKIHSCLCNVYVSILIYCLILLYYLLFVVVYFEDLKCLYLQIDGQFCNLNIVFICYSEIQLENLLVTTLDFSIKEADHYCFINYEHKSDHLNKILNYYH